MHAADQRGGAGGGQPEYPEQWKRERLLWFVHERIQERRAQGDYAPMLQANDVEQWGHAQEGLNGAQAMTLFQQLVEEGYIATNWLDTNIDELPRLHVGLRYLTTQGLREIGELPDPNQRLLVALDATHRAIEQDPSIPEEDKRDMLDTLQKMSSLANNVSRVVEIILQNLG
jgi:hypothetical protein